MTVQIRLRNLCLVFIGATCFYAFYKTFEPPRVSKKILFHLPKEEVSNSKMGGRNLTLNARVSIRKPIYGCPTVPLSKLESTKTTRNKIPLILHQIYKTYNVPRQYVSLIEGCQRINSDFVLMVWTDKIAAEFIEKKYPQYQNTFSKYTTNAEKSDFIRVLLLYHFGGVYIDMDVECRKPLSKHLDKFDASAILDQERRLQTRLRWNKNYSAMNSVMISRKDHPFFKYLLDKFSESLKLEGVMWRTGPFYLTDRLLEYNLQKRTKFDRVYLASPYSFSPLLDPVLLSGFNQQCTGSYTTFKPFIRLGCLEWDHQGRRQDNVADLVKNSLMVHRFMHLVYKGMAYAIKERVDVCTLANVFKPLL